MKKPSKLFYVNLIATIALILCFTLVACGKKQDVPSAREQAIYQLILDAAYKFKNPSAVRVISGKANYTEITEENINDKEYSDLELERGYFISANLRISSTNGYGATTTEYYHIIYDRQGKISVENLNDTIEDFMEAAEKVDSVTKPLILQSLQAALDWYDECEILNDFDLDKINKMLDDKWGNS